MKVENMLPEVYYKESRDFAFIGRLIEILFNYMKTGADCVKSPLTSASSDANMIQLLVNTLGFDSKREYINKDLVYIASTFCELLKNKGTSYAIDTAIRLLLNSQNIKDYNDNNFVSDFGDYLEIKIPEDLNDLVLLEDLFDYILPVGTIYKFVKVGNRDTTLKSKFKSSDNVRTNNADKTSYVTGSEEIASEDKQNGLGTIFTGNILSNDNLNTAVEGASLELKSPAKLNDKNIKGESSNE